MTIRTLLLMAGAGLILAACATTMQTTQTEQTMQTAKTESNPFMSDYDTPFGIPPFEKITEDHYMPAFKAGMAQHAAEIDAIADQSAPPTFANTIVAMEHSGALLTKVQYTFYNLGAANTNDEHQATAREVSPMLSEHFTNIALNDMLFQRVQTIYNQRAELGLTIEQMTLLTDSYKGFVRGGAKLQGAAKDRMREINTELSELSLKFSDNILAENNRFELVIEDEADLAGLTDASIAAAADAATEHDYRGKWMFTLHKPSLIPFLQYSQRRELREKMFTGYITRGDHGDEYDNNAILTKMAALRVERANLLGYATHADYVLEENMARKPAAVYELLDQLWVPALARAKGEAAEFQAMIDSEGGGFQLEAWDWWYYAEKVKTAKYDLDAESLRPYFKIENVRDGAFMVANRLWGLTFHRLSDVPVYHPDVQTFEVKEADGTHVGVLMMDFFPRASKRGGAWMNEFHSQEIRDGVNIRPIIYNVFNFSPPNADGLSLITQEEASTLFHEFGHALQGLLSNVTYASLSGTNVSRDYVEMCSQVMENWAADSEVMKEYAVHYETGEPIPDELITKIQNAAYFNQGFATVEYLAASYLDMAWHTRTTTEVESDPDAFEDAALERIGLIPEIVSRYRSPYFAHIFAGGYSSGYYSYVWAEVLDADLFQAFKETSLYDQATAQAFRKNILETGGTEEPMVLYKRFRGREPEIEPLLVRRGLK